jgi:hypothetical protein
VNLAGRLLADAPLAFFITATFVAFLFAERTGRASSYLLAGLAAGMVFWIKEVVIEFLLVFGVYAVMVAGRWNRAWLWMALGVAVMVAANCALQWAVTGDPLHLFSVISTMPDKYRAAAARVDSSPWFYFRYLLLDIRHTWLMPWLALAGAWLWVWRRVRRGYIEPGMPYAALWAAGLLAVFSFLPISFRPFTLIAKQSNYMSIFLAPLCLIAGWFLARFRGKAFAGALTVVFAGSIVLAGLEQQSIRVFTANSKAAVVFAREHPKLPVYGMTNAYRAGIFARLIHGGHDEYGAIRDLSTLDMADLRQDTNSNTAVALAIVDWETATWGRTESIRRTADVPACWRKKGTLAPIDFGAGAYIIDAIGAVAKRAPAFLGALAMPLVGSLIAPRPAEIYEIPAGCEFALISKRQ